MISKMCRIARMMCAGQVGCTLLHLKRLCISPTVGDVEVGNWNGRVPWKAKQC